MKLPVHALIFSLMLLVITCAEQPGQNSEKIVDGVRFIENNSPLWGSERKISLEFIRKIGEAEGTDENYILFKPNDVALAGDYACVANWDEGLRIVDIQNPQDPQEVGHYSNHGSIVDAEIQGDYCYLAASAAGLRIIDILDLEDAFEIGFCETPGEAIQVDVDGNYAYVAVLRGGLQIIDIADPENPFEIGFYESDYRSDAVAINGNIVYLAVTGRMEGDWMFSDLIVIDVSDPENPEEIRTLLDIHAENIVISGNLAYLASGGNGLWVMDISNPEEPDILGHAPHSASAHAVAIGENYAYVAAGRSGVHVVDISNPDALEVLWTYDTEGQAYGVAVTGNFTIVVDPPYGLRIIDFSDPINPVETGFYNTRGNSKGIVLTGNTALLADGSHLGIYDFSETLSIGKGKFVLHPSSAILYPAYPNPFNSTTTISFGLDKSAPTRLAVYDLNGQLVDVLLDRVMPAGRHYVVWEGRDFSAGVYIVKLEGSGQISTGKTILIK